MASQLRDQHERASLCRAVPLPYKHGLDMISFETRDGLKAEESSVRADLAPLLSAGKQRQQPYGFASISGALRPTSKPVAVFTLAKASQTQEKLERGYRILKIQGDGRCLFRALAQGLSRNKGVFISEETETNEAALPSAFYLQHKQSSRSLPHPTPSNQAPHVFWNDHGENLSAGVFAWPDELRLAVRDALCRTEKRKKEFKSALISLEATEGPLDSYCERLISPSFWGGEVELLVLSKMLHTPIYVYRTGQESGRKDGGFETIVRYGEEYSKPSKKLPAARRPVKLLFYQGNHYNLLL